MENHGFLISWLFTDYSPSKVRNKRGFFSCWLYIDIIVSGIPWNWLGFIIILVNVNLLPFFDLRMLTEFEAWQISFFPSDLKPHLVWTSIQTLLTKCQLSSLRGYVWLGKSACLIEDIFLSNAVTSTFNMHTFSIRTLTLNCSYKRCKVLHQVYRLPT